MTRVIVKCLLKKTSAIRFITAFLMGAACLVMNSTIAHAAAALVTDQAQWEAMVLQKEAFLTTGSNIVLADEVISVPGTDEQLGSVLTFQSVSTGLSRGFVVETLEPGAGFTFNDGGFTDFLDALSVGDSDSFEDDDWQLSLLDGATMTAFGVTVRNSRSAMGEVMRLYSGASEVAVLDLSVLPGTDVNIFVGVISDVPFDRVVFDEDPDGDDIALADFRFASGILFTTNLTLWEALVSTSEAFISTADNIALADEVLSLPGTNEQLGPVLTFQSVATGLSRGFAVETLEAGAGITFNDSEVVDPLPGFENALSIGDNDDFEDDDWQLSLLDGATMNAFGVEIRNSRFASGESIRLYSGLNEVAVVDLSALPDTDVNIFIGVLSDIPFDRIVFDEDPDGDDIAIADIRFADFGSCPNLPVRIHGTLNYYTSIQTAYDDTLTGETIQGQDAVFTEDLVFDLEKSVFFEGGYDCDYASVTGKTTVSGTVTFASGSVTIVNGTLEVQ